MDLTFGESVVLIGIIAIVVRGVWAFLKAAAGFDEEANRISKEMDEDRRNGETWI